MAAVLSLYGEARRQCNNLIGNILASLSLVLCFAAVVVHRRRLETVCSKYNTDPFHPVVVFATAAGKI
jgi:hypothetical protein